MQNQQHFELERMELFKRMKMMVMRNGGRRNYPVGNPVGKPSTPQYHHQLPSVSRYMTSSNGNNRQDFVNASQDQGDAHSISDSPRMSININM